jgi:AraC-like DNA-binding protein
MELKNLIETNFNVIFINAMQQFWREEKQFNCINEPKRNSLLLYLCGYSIEYIDKNGKKFIAKSGDVVYTPPKSEYIATLKSEGEENPYTIGVNFSVLDMLGNELSMGDSVTIFSNSNNTSEIFKNLLSAQADFPSPIKKRILLMEILHTLSSYNAENKQISILSPAISLLVSHPEKALSISDLAKACAISEVYFRKKFKQTFGLTPVEYRNNLRLEQAKNKLESNEMTIQEISDFLGYSTVSHFINSSKKSTGYLLLPTKKTSSKSTRFYRSSASCSTSSPSVAFPVYEPNTSVLLLKNSLIFLIKFIFI